MMKTDLELKQHIEAELRWDPKVNAAQIGVSVDKGAVSLLGAVDTFAQKWAAEDATKRVTGVRTIALDLTVKILTEHTRTDAEIAGATQSALTWDVYVPKTVTAKVEQGAITLEGQVEWNYERDAAERAVRYLAGVVSVCNAIVITPKLTVTQVKESVQAALHRQATADGKSIHVDTSGSKVTLTGHASSLQAIQDAAWAAWSAPGVTEVVDKLTMQP
jgi:osmotically-inducible protein OsmY